MSNGVTKHTYTYCRVSTDHQHVENQEKSIKDWIKSSGEKNVVQLSEVVSGRKMTGEKLAKMWQDVKDGKVKKVVVWSQDRLGRNMIQACQFVECCLDNDVEIFVLTAPDMKLNSPEGKLMFHFFMGFAEYEWKKISQKTKVGLQRAKHRCGKCKATNDSNVIAGVFRCVVCGHDTPTFFGFTKGTTWISAKTAKKVPEVLQLHGIGLNMTRIKKLTGLDARTIARIIENQSNPVAPRPCVWNK